MKTNSKRSIEAAANYVDSLCTEGKNSVLLQTFDGDQFQGTIWQQEVEQYTPLKIIITIIDSITKEYLSFDMSDILSIQPLS